jgi:hypothetical protein
MVFTGFDEGAMAYDLQRAHSADIWFLKFRAYFWGSCVALCGFLVGNIMGVFGVNIMGEIFNQLGNLWHHIGG